MVDSPKTKDLPPMSAIKFPPSNAIERSPLPPPKQQFVEIAGWHPTESPDGRGTQLTRIGASWLVRAVSHESIEIEDPYLQLFHLYQGADAGGCLLSCRLEIRALPPACPPLTVTLGVLAGVYFDRLNSLSIQPTDTWQSIDLRYHCQPLPDATRILARLHLQSATQVEVRKVELWQAAC
jgi:hypothetical protein